MKRNNRLLFLVAALLAMTAGAAMAQPPERPGPPGIEMIYGGRLERDLKLSDDVAGKLAQLRDEIEAALDKECRDAGINDPRGVSKMTPEQRDKYVEIRRRLGREFNPKAAALLSSDQLKRLQQIDFQSKLKARAPDALLAEEVAAELKLTNDQRQTLNSLKSENAAKQLERGFNRAEYMGKALAVLTDEQKATLNKLKGEELLPDRPTDEERLAQYQRGVPNFYGYTPSVPMVHFAALVAVQKELAVSDEVARKLTLLRDDFRATYKKACQDADILQSPGQSTVTAEFQRKNKEIGRKLDEAFIPKVNELLSADQQKRYQQILFQHNLKERGPAALLDVAAELKLTDDQQQKLKALTRTPRIESLLRATMAVELLTAEQKATLDTLKGSEFDLSQLVFRGRTRDT